jgi:hypothetical protein
MTFLLVYHFRQESAKTPDGQWQPGDKKILTGG